MSNLWFLRLMVPPWTPPLPHRRQSDANLFKFKLYAHIDKERNHVNFLFDRSIMPSSYAYLVDVKNALSMFPTICVRTCFIHVYIRWFYVFIFRFACILCVFPTCVILADQHWKAAELKPPGGLQAGASEVMLCSWAVCIPTFGPDVFLFDRSIMPSSY